MTHRPFLAPVPASVPASATGPRAPVQGAPPKTLASDPSHGPKAQKPSAPARSLSSAPDPATATADWQGFAEQILDVLAAPTHAHWTFDEVQCAAEDEEDDSGPGAGDRPDRETAFDEDGGHGNQDADGATADRPTGDPAEQVEEAAETATDPDPVRSDNEGADTSDDDPDWDHPEDTSPPDDPLDWLDPDQIPGLSTLPIPPIPPRRDPREGLIPRLLPTLAVLRIARTFGSLENLHDRLRARGAITVIATGAPALGTVTEGVLSVLLTVRDRSAKQPFIGGMEESLESSPGRNRGFPGLREPLDTALLRGRSVVLVATDATDLPKPIAALAPKVIRLAPLDRQLLVCTLRLTHPDIEPPALDDLPDDASLAELSLASLALAFRAPDGQSLASCLAQALETGPAAAPTGPGLHDFPMPASVRDAVDQLLADLKDWQAGRLQWKDVTRGFLLHGPPGSGKTELARLIAREAEVTFFGTSLAKLQASGSRGSDTIRELRALFAKAAAAAPAIVFIDELDAVGDRDRQHDHNSSWTNAIVAGFLEVLDGFESLEGVLSIAATNYPHKIDAALRRPGRFDRLLTLGHPDPDQIPQAIRWHLGRDLPDADLTPLARQCIGMSGAEVARLVRSARAMARRQREPLAIRHLEASLVESRPPLDETLRWRIAVHEAGHALAAHLTGHGMPRSVAVHAAGGFAETAPLATSATLAQVEAALAMLLAGRAAETVVLGEVSGGAGGSEDSDIAKATNLAAALEISLGLGDSLLWRAAPDDVNKVLRDDAELRRRVKKRLEAAERQAVEVLACYEAQLVALARALDQNSLLQGDDLSKFFPERSHLSGPTARLRAE